MWFKCDQCGYVSASPNCSRCGVGPVTEQLKSRIAALEATERELREALKVLAADLLNGWHYADTGKDWPDSTTSEVHNNPIAAAAVREAGR